MRTLVNIDVADVHRGVAFYRDGLGFSFRRFLFDETVAELDRASCRINLLLKPAGTPAAYGAGDVRHYRRHWTPVHLDFEVADVDTARVRALTAGATAEGEIRQAAWGRLAMMSDPFGHGFCLLQFSERGYDAMEQDSG